MINGNRIYACPIGIYISDEPGYTTTSTVPNRITISNNSFDLCTTYSIQMTNSAYISITGNRFEGPTGSNTVKHIVATDVQQVVIGGNIFNGAAYGIYVDNPEIGVQNVTVQGNTFSSQYAGAIRFFQDGVYGLALAGCQASGNVISNDTTAGNGYVGINLNWPTMAQGNTISLTNNAGAISGVVGILLVSAANMGGGGSYAIGNVVRGTAQYGIQTYGGSAGSVISGNLTTATTPLSIGGGTVTTPATFGTPTIAGRSITVVPVVSGGAGYSGTPYIGAIGGGGSGFTLTPVMSGGAIASVTVTSGGTGFSSPPTIYASGNFVANNQTVL